MSDPRTKTNYLKIFVVQRPPTLKTNWKIRRKAHATVKAVKSQEIIFLIKILQKISNLKILPVLALEQVRPVLVPERKRVEPRNPPECGRPAIVPAIAVKAPQSPNLSVPTFQHMMYMFIQIHIQTHTTHVQVLHF